MKTLPFGRIEQEAKQRHDSLLPRMASTDTPYIVRQPIFAGPSVLAAYELLFRASTDTSTAQRDSELAGARGLADAILSLGIETLTQGRPAFVNIPRESLLDGLPLLLPASHVVLELPPDIAWDAEALAACRALKQAGYRIALDDFAMDDGLTDFLPLANFVKVATPTQPRSSDRTELLRQLGPRTPTLIATNIETHEQLDQAERRGFTHFQGFYFGRPVMRPAQDIRAQQVACLRLLQALNDRNLSLTTLEDIIKRDAMLTYRLLRTVSSAATALPAGAPAVHSVRLALVLLGRDTVRRWASLWTVTALADPHHDGQTELVAMAIIRARCCELLDRTAQDDGYLLGVCSLLDALLGRPLPELLELLPLSEETRRALAGEQNPRRTLLDCVIAYERGEWTACEHLAGRAGLDPHLLPLAYREALSWTLGLTGPAA